MIITTFLLLPILASADYLGQQTNFFIESSYDSSGRTKITATLKKITDKLYFYTDDQWWDSLRKEKEQEIRLAFVSLSQEFNQNIYSELTSFYGLEWTPGIDDDSRITVLIHPMPQGIGGYFNSGDEYLLAQNSTSNEREMVYLSTKQVKTAYGKALFAHEFMHLVIFNQKEKEQGIEEEVWLNEARSEYAPTLVGYDDEYSGSNLQRRVYNFLESPNDSITEWQGKVADYGVLNLFTQYLVEHYGKEILRDSLHSAQVGIPSINYALEKNGFEKDFAEIFTDWTIAVLLNDCNIGEKYCYLNENLKNLRVAPQVNFLPSSGQSTLTMVDATKNWAGNWHKIIGGKDVLKVEFVGDTETEFNVSYLVEDLDGNIEIKTLKLNEEQKGTIYIPDFGRKNVSLTFIPTIQNKILGFDSEEETSFAYYWSATTVKRMPEQEEEFIKELQEMIALLQKEVIKLKIQIDEILNRRKGNKNIPVSFTFEKNLFLGMDDIGIIYLKIFLDREVSHQEWSGSSYFGSKTQQAVKTFQEKYKAHISEIVGYEINSTGFVGPGTRAKINEILNK